MDLPLALDPAPQATQLAARHALRFGEGRWLVADPGGASRHATADAAVAAWEQLQSLGRRPRHVAWLIDLEAA